MGTKITAFVVELANLTFFHLLSRQYVLHVENKFRQAGNHVEVLFLSPRMSLEKVLLQLNYENVRAVVFVENGFDAQEIVSMLIFDGNTAYIGEFLICFSGLMIFG